MQQRLPALPQRSAPYWSEGFRASSSFHLLSPFAALQLKALQVSAIALLAFPLAPASAPPLLCRAPPSPQAQRELPSLHWDAFSWVSQAPQLLPRPAAVMVLPADPPLPASASPCPGLLRAMPASLPHALLWVQQTRSTQGSMLPRSSTLSANVRSQCVRHRASSPLGWDTVAVPVLYSSWGFSAGVPHESGYFPVVAYPPLPAFPFISFSTPLLEFPGIPSQIKASPCLRFCS